MAKHMNVEVNDDKSKVVYLFIIVLMVLFGIGWGENYLAQQRGAERLEEAAQKQEIIDNFQAAMDEYGNLVPGKFKYDIDIVEDGVDVYTWNMAGRVITKTSDHYGWNELVEKTDSVRAETLAAQYSV